MATWLVTGSSRGIGLEFVRQIASAGDTVFATVRNTTAPALEHLAASYPVSIIQLDTTDNESIIQAAHEVERQLDGKGLDYLINNAAKGGSDAAVASTIDPDNFMDLIRTNALGPALVTQAFLPALRRSKRSNGPAIMNTVSGLGSIGLDFGPKNATYAISKCALNMLTYKQSKENPDMIFFAMDPGWVRTDMGGPYAQLEIPYSVKHQYEIITESTKRDSGTFKLYNGTTLPW